jgi:hypothetical protein
MAENMRRLDDYERRKVRRGLWALPLNLVAGVLFGFGVARVLNAGEPLTFALLVGGAVVFFAAQWIRTGPVPPVLTPPPDDIRSEVM